MDYDIEKLYCQVAKLEDRFERLKQPEIPKYGPLGCRVYRNATQSIPDDADTALAFNTETHDTDGCWAVANPTKLYARTAGYYLAGGSIQWDSNFNASSYIYVRQDGTDRLATSGHEDCNGFLQGFFTVTAGMFWMDVDEYVEIIVRQSSGGAINVAAANATNSNCLGWLVRII